MSDQITIVVPSGMFGADDDEPILERLIRKLSVVLCSRPNEEWAEKYGTNYENADILIHRYCWCEQDRCPWCNTAHIGCLDDPCLHNAPNVYLKRTDLKVYWYKYIGRDMQLSRPLEQRDVDELVRLIDARSEPHP